MKKIYPRHKISVNFSNDFISFEEGKSFLKRFFLAMYFKKVLPLWLTQRLFNLFKLRGA